MTTVRTAQEIISYFQDWPLDDESRPYVTVHARRYVYLLARVEETLARLRPSQAPFTILDIGPAYQTELLRKSLPRAIINTLGFADPRFKSRPRERHFEFDLNDARDKSRWPKISPHDLVILAEVIEHLYTSPVLVLRCLKSWLKPGGFLIIQTPNAVALDRRAKMLLGRHPYEMIRDTPKNPGHFREYTLGELLAVGHEVGFKTVSSTAENYFDSPKLTKKLYNAVSPLLPPNLRQGLTVIFQKR